MRRLSAVEEIEKLVASDLSRASRLRQSNLHAASSGRCRVWTHPDP